MPETTRRTTFAKTADLLYDGQRGPDVLVLSDSPIELLHRAQEWEEETGAPSVMTSLLSIPVPLYLSTDTPRTFSGVPARMLWHPLFWLPPRIAERYQIQGADGLRVEGDVEWAYRVCLEMAATGMYDPDDESWTDILSLVGLDIEDDIDLARIESWQGGEPDEDLDAIAGELDALLAVPEEDATYALAGSSLGALTGAAMARTAGVLLHDELEPLLDPDADESVVADTAHDVVTTVVNAASLFLTELVPGVEDTLWNDLLADLSLADPADHQGLLDDIAGPAAQALETIEDYFAPALAFWEDNTDPDRLPELEDEPEGQPEVLQLEAAPGDSFDIGDLDFEVSDEEAPPVPAPSPAPQAAPEEPGSAEPSSGARFTF